MLFTYLLNKSFFKKCLIAQWDVIYVEKNNVIIFDNNLSRKRRTFIFYLSSCPSWNSSAIQKAYISWQDYQKREFLDLQEYIVKWYKICIADTSKDPFNF